MLIIIHQKKLFKNISGAIHSNNIWEILILFEYFQNMYRPFVNLGIGTSALELELEMELELELILQTQLFPVP